MQILTVSTAPREYDGLALNNDTIRVYRETLIDAYVCEHPKLGMSKKFPGPAEAAARRWLAECGFSSVTFGA